MFRKAQRSRPNSDQELRVAAAILASSQDPRAKHLFDQMALRRRNLRQDRKDGFVVTVPATTDDLVVDLDEDVESAWVRVPDMQSGQLLEFRVMLSRGGFFHALEGRAVEGSWPSKWRVDEVGLGQAARGALRLPSTLGRSCQDALAAWLGSDLGGVLHLACFPPAGRADCEELVRQHGLPLPDGYEELLSITNGCDLGSLRIYGSKDAHAIDVDGKQWWVIADDPAADRYFLAGPGPSTITRATASARPSDLVDSGLGLRAWLADVIRP